MIILDFETNSTNPKDVLEVGAYRVVHKNNRYEIIDTFHRYYFSKYEVNYFALDVHNLSPDKIEKLRKGVNYSKYFEADKDFITFCKGTKTLVAHNVSFELRYLDNIINFENNFCTMKENRNIVNAKNINGNIKNPKLIETCKHYNIKFDIANYHSALYDAEKALEILNIMNNITNNFDIINHTVEEEKRILEEKELEKINKIQQKFTKQLDIEKRKIASEHSFQNRVCLKCNSSNVHKKGKRWRRDYQVQRYQCMDCKSIFQEKIEETADKLNLLSSNEIEKKAKENLFKKAVEKREDKILGDKEKITSNETTVLNSSNFENKNKEKNSFIKKIFEFFGHKT